MLSSSHPEEKLGTIHPQDAVRLVVLGSPLAVVALLMARPTLDPALQVPGFHFGIVTLAAALAAMVALAVLAAAEGLGDPRAFFLGLAFCAIAGFLFIHGLLTPGVIIKYFSNGIGWAPVLSLFLGAACLALSTAKQRPDGEPWVFRHRKALAAALFVVWAGFMALSLMMPKFLDGHPTSFVPPAPAGPDESHHTSSVMTAAKTPQAQARPSYMASLRYDEYDAPASPPVGAPAGRTAAAPPPTAAAANRQPYEPWIAGILIGTTAVLLVFSLLRYARIYRLSRLPLHATIVAGIILLLESLVPLSLGTVWRLSWWGYHVLILVGVLTILCGMILDYRRGSSLAQTISALLLRGSVEALEHSYSEALTALTVAVEARDPYTKGHSEKVARLAARIAEHLELPPERLRLLHQAGLMHDIGKIAIPDGILNKPGRLTPSELAVVREHPLRSEEMIAHIPSLRPTLRAIRWHHERLDGSGYPDGLSGERIPLDARILAVADVFDAMTSNRSYRAAWPAHAVLAHLRQDAGRLYDARCVEALEHVLGAPSPEREIGLPVAQAVGARK